MNRKKFIKSLLYTGAVGAIVPLKLTAKSKNISLEKNDKQIGFNHLPNKELKTMNTVVHRAASRGNANHGWLNSYHTFSFANYYNPDRMNFGVLRVLNDDSVAAGQGFGTHPHKNMEIISIPLEGDLEHKDSMGNVAVIKEGDVQVMSAGTGIRHSEFNKNKNKEVKFLQIWVFPKHKNVSPRYDQISVRDIAKENSFYQVLSPNKNEQGVWINQDAWFSLAHFQKGKSDHYKLNKKGNGVYLFVLDGEVQVDNQGLAKRDGMGIWDVDSFSVKATSEAKVLLMEVPMQV